MLSVIVICHLSRTNDPLWVMNLNGGYRPPGVLRLRIDAACRNKYWEGETPIVGGVLSDCHKSQEVNVKM